MPESDVVLTAERDHLAESRDALRRMREHTAGLTAIGGDHVSTEHLKQALYRRMQALRDDPTVPLFFGRLDYDDRLGAEQDETLYIGRRHVTGEAGGEPLVIDWRAGMSLPFYRARPGEPMGVRRRRRFGFAHGRLTAYEDEDLATGQPAAASEILESEIERPRTGPMRDIVATIQPEQDLIVRAGLAQSLCVQGAPGTGKTAVGLHRAAFLLYAFRDQLARSGVLVVGPNDSFLSYIGDVLPALGEIDATQATVASLVAGTHGIAVRSADPVPAALIKGDARMAEVLRNAVWQHLGRPEGALVVPRGAHQWRVGGYLAEEILDELRARGVRYEAGRAMLPQRLAHQVLLRMEAAGDSPDDRVQNAVARSKPVRAYADALWPALDPAEARAPAAHRPGIPGPGGRRGAQRGRAADDPAPPSPALSCGGPLDAGRRDPDRRGRRPAAAHAQPRTRDPRRGPGPVADDAARGRAPGQHRLGHRARRPRPGDDALGHPLLVGVADPPRPPGGGDRGAGRRVPGARRGDRLRRPAAAAHRAHADPAALGPAAPRRAGPPVRRPTRTPPWWPPPGPPWRRRAPSG